MPFIPDTPSYGDKVVLTTDVHTFKGTFTSGTEMIYEGPEFHPMAKGVILRDPISGNKIYDAESYMWRKAT